jgi:translation initiation factor IF-3
MKPVAIYLKLQVESQGVRKSSLVFGREVADPKLGMEVLNRIHADLEEEVKIELFPKMEGRLAIYPFE